MASQCWRGFPGNCWRSRLNLGGKIAPASQRPPHEGVQAEEPCCPGKTDLPRHPILDSPRGSRRAVDAARHPRREVPTDNRMRSQPEAHLIGGVIHQLFRKWARSAAEVLGQEQLEHRTSGVVIKNDSSPTSNTSVGRLVTSDLEAAPRLLRQEGHQGRSGPGCGQNLVAMAKKPKGDNERPSCRPNCGEPHRDHGGVKEVIDLPGSEGTAKIGDVHACKVRSPPPRRSNSARPH